jgi:hypothetical protein
MNSHPVNIELLSARPKSFQRVHVLLRLLFFVIVGAIFRFSGGFMGVFYFLLPGVTAVLLAQHGAAKFISADSSWLTMILRWYVALGAYVLLLTDELPTQKPEELIRLEVTAEGNPSIGSALMRLLLSIPSFLVLGLLSVVAGFAWAVAATSILIREDYPESLYRFLQGILYWQGRLLPYHASLTDEYPPFSLSTEPPFSSSAQPRPQP